MLEQQNNGQSKILVIMREHWLVSIYTFTIEILKRSIKDIATQLQRVNTL